jgi:DNA-binding NarL/FixJ family response regulator
VPRGSFHPAAGATFSALGRLILDRLDRGVILLDRQARVLDANAMARRVLHDRNGMQLRGGRLRFTDKGMNERVARLVTAQRSGPRGSAQAIAAWVRHDEAPPYRVVVTTVPDDPDERGAALVILIFGPLGRRYIAPEVLTQVYGLTRAQAEVARGLFAGLSVEQVAAVLELSLNTVRTHLKHIFTKCDVQSQGELLQLLASGPQDL